MKVASAKEEKGLNRRDRNFRYATKQLVRQFWGAIGAWKIWKTELILEKNEIWEENVRFKSKNKLQLSF